MSAHQQYCTFFLDDYCFGIEVEKVQEVIRYQELRTVPLSPPAVRGLINLRGQIVTAIDLRRQLGMSDLPQGALPMNVVIRSAEGIVALLVDEIGEVIEPREEICETPPRTIHGKARNLVEGIYQLNSRLLLILDTEKAITLDNE